MVPDQDTPCISPLDIPEGFRASLIDPEKANRCYLLCQLASIGVSLGWAAVSWWMDVPGSTAKVGPGEEEGCGCTRARHFVIPVYQLHAQAPRSYRFAVIVSGLLGIIPVKGLH